MYYTSTVFLSLYTYIIVEYDWVYRKKQKHNKNSEDIIIQTNF